MKIYLDENYCCHLTNDGNYMEHETDKLDRFAPEVIEGYRLIPEGHSWTNSEGVTFEGEMVAPWIISSKLDAIQREYEQKMLNEYESLINELYAEVTE